MMTDEPREFPNAVDVRVLDAMDPDDGAAPDEMVLAKGRCPECGVAAAWRQARGSETIACGWCGTELDLFESRPEIDGRLIRRIARWRRPGDPAKRRPGRVPPVIG